MPPEWLSKNGVSALLVSMGMTGVDRPQKAKHIIMFLHDTLKASQLRNQHHQHRHHRRSQAVARVIQSARCKAPHSVLAVTFGAWLSVHVHVRELGQVREQLVRLQRLNAQVETERTQRNLAQARASQAQTQRRLAVARSVVNRMSARELATAWTAWSKGAFAAKASRRRAVRRCDIFKGRRCAETLRNAFAAWLDDLSEVVLQRSNRQCSKAVAELAELRHRFQDMLALQDDIRKELTTSMLKQQEAEARSQTAVHELAALHHEYERARELHAQREEEMQRSMSAELDEVRVLAEQEKQWAARRLQDAEVAANRRLREVEVEANRSFEAMARQRKDEQDNAARMVKAIEDAAAHKLRELAEKREGERDRERLQKKAADLREREREKMWEEERRSMVQKAEEERARWIKQEAEWKEEVMSWERAGRAMQALRGRHGARRKALLGFMHLLFSQHRCSRGKLTEGFLGLIGARRRQLLKLRALAHWQTRVQAESAETAASKCFEQLQRRLGAAAARLSKAMERRSGMSSAVAAFDAWAAHLEGRRNLVLAVKKARGGLAKRRQAGCLSRWKMTASRRRRGRAVCLRLAVRMLRIRVVQTIQRWQRHVDDRQRARRMLMAHWQRSRGSALSGVWDCWKALVEEARSLRRGARTLQKRLLEASVAQWGQRLMAVKRLDRASRRMRQRHARLRCMSLTRSFAKWQTSTVAAQSMMVLGRVSTSAVADASAALAGKISSARALRSEWKLLFGVWEAWSLRIRMAALRKRRIRCLTEMLCLRYHQSICGAAVLVWGQLAVETRLARNTAAAGAEAKSPMHDAVDEAAKCVEMALKGSSMLATSCCTILEALLQHISAHGEVAALHQMARQFLDVDLKKLSSNTQGFLERISRSISKVGEAGTAAARDQARLELLRLSLQEEERRRVCRIQAEVETLENEMEMLKERIRATESTRVLVSGGQDVACHIVSGGQDDVACHIAAREQDALRGQCMADMARMKQQQQQSASLGHTLLRLVKLAISDLER